jgi:sigma-B regulation protein RsbU (phosphoserine phosphatase)
MDSTPASAHRDSRFRLDAQVIDFNALFEFSQLLNSSLDLEFILGNILLTSMGKMMVSRGVILLGVSDVRFSVKTAKGLPVEFIGKTVHIKNLPPGNLLYIDKLDKRKYKWVRFFEELRVHILIPIFSRNRALGFVGFGEKISHKEFLAREISFLEALANIASTAIENSLAVAELKRVNRTLDNKIQQLNTLFDLGKEFNSTTLDSEKVMRLLTYSLIGQLGVSKYVICTRHDAAIEITATRINQDVDRSLLKNLCDLNQPTLVGQYKGRKHKAVYDQLGTLGLQVVVPMQIQKETKGLICLGNKMSGDEFTQTDIEFIYSLGNLAIVALENAHLFKEAMEKERLEEELVIAREIQQGFLPKTLPNVANFQISAINVSSKQVGGDYYDVIKIDDTKYLLAIADVSGKGTPASLLMANLQATLRVLAPLGMTLSDMTGRINDIIFENTGLSKFITFCCGLLDSEKHNFAYVNAGHNPPYLLHKDGSVRRLDKGGVILGIMQTLVPYEEDTAELEVGDILFMFTDGVSEAMSVGHEEFGEEHLEQLLITHRESTTEEIIQVVQEEVRKHAKGTAQSDDITIVVMKVCDN